MCVRFLLEMCMKKMKIWKWNNFLFEEIAVFTILILDFLHTKNSHVFPAYTQEQSYTHRFIKQ